MISFRSTNKMPSRAEVLKMGKFPAVAMFLQITFLVFYILFVDYTPLAMRFKGSNSTSNSSVPDPVAAHTAASKMEVMQYYGMLQHLHIMMYVGFGFLVSFIKRYGFSAVGFNFMLAALVTQWATLTAGWITKLQYGRVIVDLMAMVHVEFAIAAVLISYCVVIGKTTPLQLLIMALVETAVFQANSLIVYNVLQASDTGTSMTVHTFGAFFGLAVSFVIYRNDVWEASDKEGSQYHSDIFAIIGTLFLWMFYPTFNSVTSGSDEGRYRAIINTYYSLAACTVTMFAMSAFLTKGKLSMVHVQNSALAGGVSLGTVGDMIIYPWGAVLIGMVAGVVSVSGFRFIVKFLSIKIRLHDTCGVSSLHGIPGVISGIAGIVVASMATEAAYGESFAGQFPAMASGRTRGQQAEYQALALLSSIGTAIVGGIIAGLLLKIPIWDQPKGRENFDDSKFWVVPEEGFVSDNALPGVQHEASLNTDQPDNANIPYQPMA